MMPASHTRERRRWRAIHSAFAVAMILSLIALAASVLPALAGFQPQQAFPVGELPYAVVAEDFNGDGRPDLATTDYHYNTVSVLLNTTTPRATVPTFADQQTFPTGSRPRGIAAADFNGDGKPDLATANSGATTVSVLLNITMPGASVPTFATQQAFNVGSPPAFLAAADFNGDGKPDIVAGNGFSPGTVSVLLGIGDGTLGAPTPLLGIATKEQSHDGGGVGRIR